MRIQKCAICEKNNYQILYRENIPPDKINEKVFSARRLPDKIHYQIVQCQNCGLVYSNPIFSLDKIKNLYRKSYVAYEESLENLKKTYGHYLRQLENFAPKKNRLLDIGCGNGFFLEEALNQGYKEVFGVEPGKKSVLKAKPQIRKNIKIDFFHASLFPKNFFDVITCFQTLDHIPDPNTFLKDCRWVLKKGGLMLFINHDVGHIVNRFLGEKSPIIDIEHTYLFDKKTIKKIFEKHHFKVLKVGSATNIHNLGYWIKLFPLANFLKLGLINILKKTSLDTLKIKLAVGNLVVFARKNYY
ncbi:MAG: class I SAM-dependent methyltransferase [Microgenomates group bacterium]|nr:class I SAM-dependent methyltransferase [Microgenomates group bacterium]